jgi:GNAT superfamily N-acetyltransferase
VLRSGTLHGGVVDVARSPRGQLLGIAAWTARGGTRRLIGELPRFLGALGPRGLVRAVPVLAAFGVVQPERPSWYLGDIGVSAEARGWGVGSALLRHRLERIDALGQPARLEATTERNRDPYARHGFTPLAVVDGIDGAQPTVMWREPVACAMVPT